MSSRREAGITHLADRMPGYVASAQHGNGWIGHLVARYHVQSIVTAVVFTVYTQIENHVLNPAVMSKTVQYGNPVSATAGTISISATPSILSTSTCTSSRRCTALRWSLTTATLSRTQRT